MTDFEVRELPANVLTVDPRVQRVLDPRRVQRLAEHWNELMVGVLTVSHRAAPKFPIEGTTDHEEYVVLDGQTRLGAFRHPLVCGPTTSAPVLCQVYEGLQLPEEAAMFLQHNDRKSVRPIDNYRLSLVAGEEWAVGIHDIAAKYGWYVQGSEVPEGLDRPARRFSAIGAAVKIYKLDPDALTRTFDSVTAAWPGQPYTVCTETLNGLGLIYARHGDVDHRGLVKKLGRIGFNRFVSGVHDHRRANMGLSIGQAAYRHTLDLYNHGRRTQRLDV
jgi:hypothetical protein